MTDLFTKEQRSRIMSKIRYKDTKPEITFRHLLYNNGYRYRVNYGPEKIDIAFPRLRIAIFIDGCFWHGCPKHSHMPKSNRDYWLPKLRRNIRRAKEKDLRLHDNGWIIFHIWEHELTNPGEINLDYRYQNILSKLSKKFI